MTIEHLLNGLGPIILESIKIPFGIFDRQHTVLWANEALAAIHQSTPEALIGNICHQILHNNPTPCKNCEIQSVLETGSVCISEKKYELPDGNSIWGEVHCYPVRVDNGAISAVIVFGFDVTTSKHRIEVLQNYSKYLSEKIINNRHPSTTIQPHGTDLSIAVKLSDREREVLRLVTEGYTNRQISSILFISVNTVKTHVNSIFNKMGINDRTQAAVLAIRHKIV